MPTPRMFVGLAFGKDGLLYALGGGASEQVFTGLRVSTVLNVLEIYDPAANRWMQGAPAPTPREWPGTGFVLLPDGHLAAHGGLGLGTSASGAGVIYPTAFETYDPASNTWTARQPLPEPAPGMASLAVSGGLLYAFGGYVAADDVTAPFHPSLAIYKWVLLPPTIGMLLDDYSCAADANHEHAVILAEDFIIQIDAHNRVRPQLPGILFQLGQCSFPR